MRWRKKGRSRKSGGYGWIAARWRRGSSGRRSGDRDRFTKDHLINSNVIYKISRLTARSGAQPPGRAAGRAAASLGLLPFERCPVRFVIRLSSVVLCPARTTATCRICVTKPFPLSIESQWTGPRWLDPTASMPFREVQLPRGAEFRECLIDHCEELVRRFGDAQQGDDGVQVSA